MAVGTLLELFFLWETLLKRFQKFQHKRFFFLSLSISSISYFYQCLFLSLSFSNNTFDVFLFHHLPLPGRGKKVANWLRVMQRYFYSQPFHTSSGWRPLVVSRESGPCGEVFAPADNRRKLSATTEVITFNCALCTGLAAGPGDAAKERQRWNYKLLGHSCDCFETRARSCRASTPGARGQRRLFSSCLLVASFKRKRYATPGASPRCSSCKNYFDCEPTLDCNVFWNSTQEKRERGK